MLKRKNKNTTPLPPQKFLLLPHGFMLKEKLVLTAVEASLIFDLNSKSGAMKG